MSDQIQVSLSRTQWNDVGNLLNTAVRAEGIPAARIAMPIINLLEAQLNKPAPAPEAPADAPNAP